MRRDGLPRMGAIYPTGPPVTSDPFIQSPANPVLIVFYAFWAFAAVAFIAFWAHRRARKRAFLRAAEHLERLPSNGGFGGLNQLNKSSAVHGAPQPEARDKKDDVPGENKTRYRFFRDDSFGRFAFGLYIFFLVHLYVIAVILCLDMYWACQIRSPDSLCVFGAFPLTGGLDPNLKIFFVLWHMLLLCYGLSLLKKDKLRNWFRIPCTAEEASHVWISTPLEEEVLVHDRHVSPVVRAVKGLTARFGKKGVACHETTVPVSVSEAGSRIYEFQGSRFVLTFTQGFDFQRYHSEVGPSLADIHKGEAGLSTEDAATRLDMLGRNEVPFKAEPFGILLCKEFFAFFYLYQLLMYTIWFLDSFLTIAIVVFSVVVLAGVIKAHLVRKNQLSLEKLTAYVTHVIVLRSGDWVSVPSYELVPGDRKSVV